MKADVVIIGAGPAGLSAAAVAAEAGAAVVVIDENPRPGGKLLGQFHDTPAERWIGADVAKGLAQRAAAAGATILSGRQVWHLAPQNSPAQDTSPQDPAPQWEVALDGGEYVSATFAVVATGAAERALPLPGWTLPGVMAIGAAQTLTNYYRVRPGDRIAVVGVDPLSLTVAHELSVAGAEVVGIFLPGKGALTGVAADPDRALEYLAGMSDLAPNAFLRLGGKLAANRLLRRIALAFYPRAGLPLMGTRLKLRESVVSIDGGNSGSGGQVRSVEVASIDRHGNPGKTRTVEVDCVCLSGGLYPVQELTQGCALVMIGQLGGTIPLHSPELETSRQNLFVAGNVTGIEGAKIAMAQGRLAGTAIASRMGLLKDPEATVRAASAVRQARSASAITFMPAVEEGRRIAAEKWSAEQERPTAESGARA